MKVRRARIRTQRIMTHPVWFTTIAITQKLRIRGMVTIPGLPIMTACIRNTAETIMRGIRQNTDDTTAEDTTATGSGLLTPGPIEMRRNTFATF